MMIAAGHLRWASLAAALCFAAPAIASQSSVVTPVVGPHSMTDFATNYLNPALLSLLTNNAGASAPANGPGAAPAQWQWWVDTNASPASLEIYDGAQWDALGTVDPVAHLFSLEPASVTNAELANSTISGVALGANLPTLTFGPHLSASASSYNGSVAATIQSDATALATASTIAARDSGGNAAFAGLTGNAITDSGLSTQGVTCNSGAGLLSTSTTGCANTIQSAPLGGSGVSSPTAHGVLLGEGASAFGEAAIGTAARLLLDQGAGADPAFEALSQDCTLTSAGVITCLKTNNVSFGTFATQSYASPPAIGGTTPAAIASTTLNPTGAITAKVRSVATSTVAISATADYLLCLDPTSNAIAADLPPSPATGLTFLVKDCTGQAATHNITVTPSSGNIDGAATFVMATPYESIAVTYTGSQWSVN